MNKLIVGNWKMNPASQDEAKRIAKKTRLVASKLERTEVVACPPFVYIGAALSRNETKHFSVGAQFVSYEEGGPHTGEVSAHMLADLGLTYVIAGHSETRKHGDTDAVVAKRVGAILAAGMTPILCVGEDKHEENGSHFDVLKEQIKGSLANVDKKYARDIILAYEPVWAIGAKEAMAPEQILEMSLFVKKVFSDVFGAEVGLKVRVLYGGSVNPLNAADIMTVGKVDGLLVGRESVNVIGFTELLKAVDAVN